MMMATMVMLLGCRSSGAARQAPNDAGTSQPTVAQRALVGDEPVGEAESDTRAERCLTEERWNAAASEEPERSAVAPSEEPEPPRADGRNPSAPTEADFQAWNRKDPEGPKHVYKWDGVNFDRMEGYFHDLECFHALMVAAGKSGRGAAPGTKAAKAWADAKLELGGELDAWQKQLFTKEPRLLERSKFVGRFLEAHEVVARELPAAYDNNDQFAIDTAEAHWMKVVAWVDEYAQALGKTASRSSDAHCKAMRTP